MCFKGIVKVGVKKAIKPCHEHVYCERTQRNPDIKEGFLERFLDEG